MRAVRRQLGERVSSAAWKHGEPAGGSCYWLVLLSLPENNPQCMIVEPHVLNHASNTLSSTCRNTKNSPLFPPLLHFFLKKKNSPPPCFRELDSTRSQVCSEIAKAASESLKVKEKSFWRHLEKITYNHPHFFACLIWGLKITCADGIEINMQNFWIPIVFKCIMHSMSQRMNVHALTHMCGF